jgi:hypothetical protein
MGVGKDAMVYDTLCAWFMWACPFWEELSVLYVCPMYVCPMFDDSTLALNDALLLSIALYCVSARSDRAPQSRSTRGPG